MDNDWLQIMKESKRLKLTTIQTLTHFGVVLFSLFIALMMGWIMIQGETVDELTKVPLFFLLLSIFFFFVQYRRLKFREFHLRYTEHQFQEAVKRTTNELEWSIDSKSETFFRAYRSSNWTGSWGEMITIIKEKDRLFINSICDPNKASSIASYGWNRTNIKTFTKNLTDVLNNKPAELKIEVPTDEWSIKKIAIRLFLYPFCIFLIVFGVYMIMNPLSIITIIAALGVMSLASVYLFLDIKILLTKKGNRIS